MDRAPRDQKKRRGLKLRRWPREELGSRPEPQLRRQQRRRQAEQQQRRRRRAERQRRATRQRRVMQQRQRAADERLTPSPSPPEAVRRSARPGHDCLRMCDATANVVYGIWGRYMSKPVVVYRIQNEDSPARATPPCPWREMDEITRPASWVSAMCAKKYGMCVYRIWCLCKLYISNGPRQATRCSGSVTAARCYFMLP